MGGIDGAERKQKEVARRLSQMENRLDNALIKYNRRVAENRDLKSEINAARRQRLVYDDIYASLELELAKKKKEMANLISKTSTAMQKQDRLKSKLKNVQQQIEQEQKEFNKRWHSLGTEISMGREAHTLKLKKEMEAQGSLKDGENEADIGKNGTDNGNANAIESSAASTGNKTPEIADNVEENSIERKTKRKLARGAWAIAKEKAQIHMSAEKIQAYEVAFEKIREITGIADIEVLVDRFIEAEERNFSTFKYISHLNKELERLDSQIHEARSEIERFRGQGVETDSQRKKILRELESKLHRTETRTKDFDDRHNRVATLLTSVKKRVQDIFHRIGCRNSVAAGFVGNQGVTDRYIFFIFIFFI
jgi:chromosome segregation ATPase